MFECKICNYFTERSADLRRHNTSNKHILNEQKTVQKPIEKYKKLESENTELKNELKEIKNQYSSLVNLALQNSKAVKQSVRGITYAMRHYKTAPDVKLLEGNEAIKLLTYDNKKSLADTVDIIIIRHKNKKLKEYLGDILIDAYKKDDPKLQSFWGVDTSRLHFILKRTEWTTDKNGINLTKLLITPFLKKVGEMIHEYMKAGYEYMKNNNSSDNYSMTSSFPVNVLFCNEILANISKKKLHRSILKYISPHFDLSLCDDKKKHTKKNDLDSGNDSNSDTTDSSDSESSSSSDKKTKKIIHANKPKKKIVVSKKYESSSSDSN
jgi:hypothetical protein